MIMQKMKMPTAMQKARVNMVAIIFTMLSCFFAPTYCEIITWPA